MGEAVLAVLSGRAMLTRCCRSGLDRGWCGERGGKDGTGDGLLRAPGRPEF